MPYISVPLQRPAETPRIRIFYTTVGTGAIPVLLIPGLCTPSTMYTSLSTQLSATSAFKAISLDNRGIGKSDSPPPKPATYTTRELAADAWAVLDAECATTVGLVGHSMGGMIAQEMVVQQPGRVRFVALLSCHAGGWSNLPPTPAVLCAAFRGAVSQLDTHVLASENVALHYTEKYLNEAVPTDKRNAYVGMDARQIAHDARLHFRAKLSDLIQLLPVAHAAALRSEPCQRKRGQVLTEHYAQGEAGCLAGHAYVVASHTLSRRNGKRMAGCRRLVKIVMAGREDAVVPVHRSNKLARLIAADCYVEVDGAHFLTEEAAADVAVQIVFGLRKAFFTERICACVWCDENKEGEDEGCRMC